MFFLYIYKIHYKPFVVCKIFLWFYEKSPRLYLFDQACSEIVNILLQFQIAVYYYNIL